MSRYVDCPYCEKEIDMNDCHYESDNFDMECPYCEKDFEISVDYDPIFNSSEIIYQTCKECNKEFRYEGKCHPKPNKYKNVPYDDYIICRKCYFKLSSEDLNKL